MNRMYKKPSGEELVRKSSGVLVMLPPRVRPVTTPKKMTMAAFLQLDMSARKKVYMEALAKSVKDQQDMIDEASRISPA